MFLRNGKVLTCAIRSSGQQAHDICVIPHWDVSSSVIERHGSAASAMRRHAELVRDFREGGWMVVRDRATRAIVAA